MLLLKNSCFYLKFKFNWMSCIFSGYPSQEKHWSWIVRAIFGEPESWGLGQPRVEGGRQRRQTGQWR